MTLRCILYGLCIILLSNQSLQQHIFDETCTFEIPKSTETLQFASQVIHVSNKRFDIYINFCKSLGQLNPACDPQFQACIIRKQSAKRYIPNAAASFHTTLELDQETNKSEIVLVANNSRKCDDDFYSFKIYVKKDKNKSEISFSDECSIEIVIPHPSVQIRGCEFSYNGCIIDLMPLAQVPEQYIERNGSHIAVAACHNAPSCKSNTVSICEISPGNNIFAVAETQHAVYDYRTNALIVRGRGPNKIKSELQLHCNWTATFNNPVKLAAKYKYSIQSRFGCVKVPLNCQITDMEQYAYDLRDLNRLDGWRVGNVTLGTMLINVCGALQISRTQKNECSDRYSQICNKNGNKYLSYGALHSGFQFEDVDRITLQYTHGSLCPTNQTKYLTTKILFDCAQRDSGPIMSSMINCSMTIKWASPQACPKEIVGGTFSFASIQKQLQRTSKLSCTININGRLVDLSPLISSKPIEITRGNHKYYLNICQPLSLTKDNYFCKITGACIEDLSEFNKKKRFTWVGSVSNPEFENNELFVKYVGGYCKDSSTGYREIVIYFRCSPSKGVLRLLNESTCRTDFEWPVPQACIPRTQRSTNCIIRHPKTGGQLFDFSKSALQKFKLIFHSTTYIADICSNILFTTNETEAVSMTSRYAIQNGCDFSISYSTANKTCNSTSPLLHTFTLDLQCDDVENNNDYVLNYSSTGCTAAITAKSKVVCAKVRECQTMRELEKPQQDQANTSLESKEEQQCKIVSNGNEFMLNSIPQMNFTNRKDTFSINGNCAGFICKNNFSIATLELCPNVVLDDNSRLIMLTFTGPPCGIGDYKAQIQLTCASEPKMFILESTNCSTNFVIQSNEYCGWFPQQAPLQSSWTYGKFIGLFLGILFIFVAIICGLVYFKPSIRCLAELLQGKNRRRYAYTKNGSD